jgi:predicted TIM-barrel fold metal-dependent hydrolase
MRLTDAHCAIGARPGCRQVVTAEELVGEMQRLDVAGALVRIAPTKLAFDVPAINRRVFAMAEAYEPLIPCPVMMPNTAGDLATAEEQVEDCLERGAKAVSVRPVLDNWSLQPWASGDLFSVLEARRVPVFCHDAQCDIDSVAGLARSYPEMPIIVAGVGYRRQRVVMPLLQTFPNVHLVVGSDYCVFRGLEVGVDAVGPERFLFGTNYDELAMMAAIGYLMYADLEDGTRALIGAGNLERLMGGIIR